LAASILARTSVIAARKSTASTPARVDGLFRPHYATWSEQQKIEFAAPDYLRNIIRIIAMSSASSRKKDQRDLENRTGWIPNSKTPNGVAELIVIADGEKANRVYSGY
jgi:hypothetical protein